jgi:hypothetical protein
MTNITPSAIPVLVYQNYLDYLTSARQNNHHFTRNCSDRIIDAITVAGIDPIGKR